MSAHFPSLSDLLNEIRTMATDVSRKNRVFDPTKDPKHEIFMPTPYQLMVFNSSLQITFLCFGHKYTPTKSELKAARNVIRRAGVPAPSFDTPCYPLADTLVIELASTIEDGFAVAVRLFGYHSKYNRWEDDQSTLAALIKCVVYGCKQIRNMVETECKWVKRVIFQTDSDELMEAVTQLRDPDEHSPAGPGSVPGNLNPVDFLLLHRGIEWLTDTNGPNATQVLFWKVASEYLPGAYHQAEDEQRIIHPHTVPAVPNDSCGGCVANRQMQELMFAETGNPCRPSEELVANIWPPQERRYLPTHQQRSRRRQGHDEGGWLSCGRCAQGPQQQGSQEEGCQRSKGD